MMFIRAMEAEKPFLHNISRILKSNHNWRGPPCRESGLTVLIRFQNFRDASFLLPLRPPKKAVSEGTKAPCSSGRQFETLAGSFQRSYSKLCELVQAMSTEPIIKQILRFEPPIPQSCMVHIYLKGVPGLTMTFFLFVSILCFATIVYTYCLLYLFGVLYFGGPNPICRSHPRQSTKLLPHMKHWWHLVAWNCGTVYVAQLQSWNHSYESGKLKLLSGLVFGNLSYVRHWLSLFVCF